MKTQRSKSRKATPASTFKKLGALLPAGELKLDETTRNAHSGDKWFATGVPEAVVLASSTQSVATTLRFAHEHRIPVTPRGAGYGYVGGCVPVKGGISLSVAPMNRILEINEDDFVAVVQPGVLTKTVQDSVEKVGRFYPPDPASRADCSIGGNIATNAGGPRCLKYGVTRDYVLGLEVVLADGTVTRLGSRTHKNKTGFDLHRLFVGSEGMLGVVTEATLKLLPLPPFRASLAIGFSSMKSAVAAIRAIFRKGFLPAALELADAFTLAAARKRTGSTRLAGCEAHIIVELDGQEKSIRAELRELEKAVRTAKPLFVERAHGAVEVEAIWQLRREFSFSLRDTGLHKLNEDIVVPRGRLEDLFRFTNGLEKQYGFPVACFGHAGDGNIHVNIMLDLNKPGAMEESHKALDALFQHIVGLGGVVTGEHGIGLAKKPWWNIAVSNEADTLHHRVKQALDPHGLLNPGKFLG